MEKEKYEHVFIINILSQEMFWSVTEKYKIGSLSDQEFKRQNPGKLSL